MLDELVDEQRVLSEMQMDVAGEQVGRDETLVTDHVALRVLHLVGGLQASIVSGDTAPVELVPPVELAARREDIVLEGEELAVPEAVDLTVHLHIDGDHARHALRRTGAGAKRASEAHLTTTFGIDRCAASVR